MEVRQILAEGKVQEQKIWEVLGACSQGVNSMEIGRRV
jgi:hypothetical protein